MKNNTLEELSKVLLEANSILIFPHINIDGDALGSAVAICKALRRLDKIAYVLMEDQIPNNLKFLDSNYCTWDKDQIINPDVNLCIDCGDTTRFERRKEKFLSGPLTMCIDHHATTSFFCDYNYVDPLAPATGQIIYNLLKRMGAGEDKEIGEAVFAAITTDTGNFQYSNTNKESHLIMAQLYDWGIDSNRVSVEIYENSRMEKILIENRVISTLTSICDGKGTIAYASQEMLRETGATMDETEGVVDTLRSIGGVEVSAFLKEFDKETVKVSLRAKRKADVSGIASRHNGGGHAKAAGFTLHVELMEALAIVKKDISELLSE